MRTMMTRTIVLTPLATHLHRLSAVVLLAGVLAVPATSAGAHRGTTTRVSVDSAGNAADNGSFQPSISANGRSVAFTSEASNLVPGGANGVFVHDRKTGTTTLVSVDSAGNGANTGGSEPSLSANGRFVAFSSFATNLVPGDTNFAVDVFVHDRKTGTTTRVEANSPPDDEGFHIGLSPSISANGRSVAFMSDASNLVPGDTNSTFDVFVHEFAPNAFHRDRDNDADGDADDDDDD